MKQPAILRLILLALAALPLPLAAADGRFPISGPVTIAQPGSYYVTRDFTVGGTGSAILISSNDVTLDLNGHTIICGGAVFYCIEAVNRNRIRVTGGAVYGGGNGIDVYNDSVTGIFTVDHMQLSGQTGSAISVMSTGAATLLQARITDNRIVGASAGITLNYLDGGQVERNLIERTGTGDGIALTSASGVSVRDNTVSGGSRNGITLQSCGSIDVSNNHVSAATDYRAILLNDTNYCRISQNVAVFEGIALNTSNSNTLDWNMTQCNCSGLPFCICFGLSINSGTNNVYSNNRGQITAVTGNVDAGGNH
jgi:parallel beta-helix repeat protein